MYTLYAMNQAGTEILMSDKVRRAEMTPSMNLIAKAGLYPIAKRHKTSERTVIKRAISFYV